MGHFNIAYDIAIIEKALVLKQVTIHNEDNELISVDFEQHASSNFKPHSITSKYIDREKFNNKTFQSAKEIFSNPRTIFCICKRL